ncbi:HNH endonuclease signature motif containing protein, partial [Microbacterium sp. 2MCAF23]|uniref:HNH endonuclease signature motif containing protein n=1 Tax=Microbacterium sp. 2MCAF23 TaxID=3232985 RepID=UPI003F98F7B0
GQKMLGLIHAAAVIDGIYDRLTQQARMVQVANTAAVKDATAGRTPDPDALGDSDDDRSIDQLRADLCADTLLTGAPSGRDTTAGLLAAIQARVEVTVPVFTAMAADTAVPGLGSTFGIRTEQPAELAGGQPIDTHTARILAGGAIAWERVLTHPITGAILAVDHYRPNTDLRRLLHARDSRCRFPTCGLPPAAQDLDHTIDAAYGGATEEGNLGGLCRRHHVLKHQTTWAVKQKGAGVLEWTSPTGSTYIDKPPAPVTFTTDEPDPPPVDKAAPF